MDKKNEAGTAHSEHASYKTHRFARWVYFLGGVICVTLGIIGAFLPLLPTTIFIILAAWCFSKSSEKMENWLLTHPKFGPTLRDWYQYGAIPTRIKKIALTMITLSFLLSASILWHRWTIIGIVGGTLLLVSLYIVTRPSPPTEQTRKPPVKD